MSNLREIRPIERPICQQCNTPLDWVRNTVYYEEISGWEYSRKEIYGWEYNCNCVDTDRLKPDSTFNLTHSPVQPKPEGSE